MMSRVRPSQPGLVSFAQDVDSVFVKPFFAQEGGDPFRFLSALGRPRTEIELVYEGVCGGAFPVFGEISRHLGGELQIAVPVEHPRYCLELLNQPRLNVIPRRAFVGAVHGTGLRGFRIDHGFPQHTHQGVVTGRDDLIQLLDVPVAPLGVRRLPVIDPPRLRQTGG